MALRPEHEIHNRRRGRNLGLLAVLLLFVALVFGLSIVKITQGDLMEGFDHQPRTSLLPRTEPAAVAPASSETTGTPAVTGGTETNQ